MPILSYRTTNHRLSVERGKLGGILKNERICTQCEKNNVGDEYHYLFTCSVFEKKRVECITTLGNVILKCANFSSALD